MLSLNKIGVVLSHPQSEMLRGVGAGWKGSVEKKAKGAAVILSKIKIILKKNVGNYFSYNKGKASVKRGKK